MRRAHADAYERLSSSLLDVANIVRRLEAKLDRVVEGSILQEGSSLRGRVARVQPTVIRQSSRPDSGWDERDGRVEPFYSKKLSAVIDEICAVDQPYSEVVRKNIVSGGQLSDTLMQQPDLAAVFDSGDGKLKDTNAALQQVRIKEDGDEIYTAQTIKSGMSSQVAPEQVHTSQKLVEVDKKVDALSDSLSKKLERIAYALGIRNLNVVDKSGDDSEDRKRLKEKLKAAFDIDRRSNMRTHVVVSVKEKWLDYIFGICKPDQRIGKRGSRCFIS
jgi:hypothetical protein